MADSVIVQRCHCHTQSHTFTTKVGKIPAGAGNTLLISNILLIEGCGGRPLLPPLSVLKVFYFTFLHAWLYSITGDSQWSSISMMAGVTTVQHTPICSSQAPDLPAHQSGSHDTAHVCSGHGDTCTGVSSHYTGRSHTANNYAQQFHIISITY